MVRINYAHVRFFIMDLVRLQIVNIQFSNIQVLGGYRLISRVGRGVLEYFLNK